MEDAVVTKARRIVSQVGGSGGMILDLLRRRMLNEEVLAEVLRNFPDARTKVTSVQWYRNQLRTAGEDVPTSRELTRKWGNLSRRTAVAGAVGWTPGDALLDDVSDEEVVEAVLASAQGKRAGLEAALDYA